MYRLASSLAFLALASLLAAQDLKVSDVVVSQFEDGASFGAAEPAAPGEMVFFRFRASGYKTSDTGVVKMTGRAQAFDPAGVAVAPADEVAIATSLREEDKDWRPIFRFQFQMPAIVGPGTFRIRFEAIDEQSQEKAAGEASFVVGGRGVAPSPTLVIRDLAFYRTADEETPLRLAAYRPGDTVWVRFHVTGYKYGEQNAIDVAYGVAVTAADGKKLFEQQDAAVERSQAYYPQPWIAGSFSLTLQGTIRPGDYNVEIRARDGIGNQTSTSTAAFQVR